MELLVHTSALTTRKDDERYRAEAFAYGDFEVARRSVLAAEQNREHPPGEAQLYSGVKARVSVVLDPPAPSKLRRTSHQVEEAVPNERLLGRDQREEDGLSSSGVSVQPAGESPALSSRYLQAPKGKHALTCPSELNVGPTSNSPLQRLEAVQKQWRKRQSLLGHSTPQALDYDDQPLRPTPNDGILSPTENTQAAAVALESQVKPWSTGVSPGFTQSVGRTYKRRRLSQVSITSCGPGKTSSKTFTSQKELVSLEQSPRTPICDFPTQHGNLDSQLPAEYGLSNSGSGSSLRVSRIRSFQFDVESSSEATPPSHPTSQAASRTTTVTRSQTRARFRIPAVQRRRSEVSMDDRQGELPHPFAESRLPQTPSVKTIDTSKPQDEPNTQKFTDFSTIVLPPAYFAALPREVLPPPPRTSMVKCRTLPSQVTETMTELLSDPELTDKYQPMHISRDLDPTEIGHWRVNTAKWPSYDQAVFWESLSDLILKGRLGFKSTLTREDWAETGRTDGLGIVKLFTWGETIRHTYLLLYAQSSGKLRHGNAQWIDARGEIVVEMRR